jgi:Domain of unknown function (DUF4342)
MDTFNQTQSTTTEIIELKSSQLVEQVKQLIHEGNVRRIVVKQDERSIVEFPLALGVVGTLLAAPLAALGALGALLNDCTIEVEREEVTPVAVAPAAGQTTSQDGAAASIGQVTRQSDAFPATEQAVGQPAAQANADTTA